jgi:ribosomal protein S18 acetylase RimI-like enzyme
MTETQTYEGHTATPAPEEPAHVLDNPAYAALTGPHAPLAERRGRVLRYPVDVSPWLALPDDPGPEDWADLAALVGPGAVAPLPGTTRVLPEGWERTQDIPGVQLVGGGVAGAHDPEAVRLTPADVPAIPALVARTRPGPFLPRTIELGTYLGIRRGGALVAMAGERLHPPGWTEISAVCTDQEYRGQGLAAGLVRALVAGIRARGEQALLHAAASNTGAIRLYESMGFRLRVSPVFTVLRVPAHERLMS